MNQKNIKLEKGDLLIAQPFMLDPNFRRSVIAICDHTDGEGTVGFVLNKPINMNVNDLIAEFPEFESGVFFGGPVATDTIHYIHTKGDILDESHEIMNGLYWGGDFEQLKFLIETKMILPTDIRFYVGYTGWSAGQLKEELLYGSWISADLHPNYVFKEKGFNLWSRALHHKGDRYTVIAQIPSFISLN